MNRAAARRQVNRALDHALAASSADADSARDAKLAFAGWILDGFQVEAVGIRGRPRKVSAEESRRWLTERVADFLTNDVLAYVR